MRILGETNDVTWISFHGSRRPQMNLGDLRAIVRRVFQSWGRSEGPRAPFEVRSPLVLPWPENRLVRWANARLLSRQVRAGGAGKQGKPLQLWLFTPDVPELIPLLCPERVVYYCVDEFSAFAGFNAGLMERLEGVTVSRSDVVIATSEVLYDRLRARHARTYHVPHGVDFDHFASALSGQGPAIPEEVAGLSGPVFGYFGLISDYVDVELIASLARRRRSWQFVLLGDARVSLEALAGLGNVHVLGGRPYASLPAYCRKFDVGLIPFRMNALTRAVNPIKLREYLAAGLPVVSTPMPALFAYRRGVFLAEGLDAFEGACESALRAGREVSAAERQALVRGESWRARVETLSGVVMGEWGGLRSVESLEENREQGESESEEQQVSDGLISSTGV